MYIPLRVQFYKEVNMEFQDKKKTCTDCGKEFIFTAGEQAFYKERGLENEPKRCKECRDKRKAEKAQGNK